MKGDNFELFIKLIGIGIVIGVIITFIIISIVDLSLAKVKIGPFEFEKSTETPTLSVDLTEESVVDDLPQSIEQPLNTPVAISPSPTFTPEPLPTNTPEPIMSIQQHDIKTELLGCKISGTIVTCEFRFFNEGEDVEFFVFVNNTSEDSAEIYDNFGNQYIADNMKIANEYSSYRVGLRLVSQVWVSSEMIFENVDSQATSISLLLMHGMYRDVNGDNYDYPIEFRDIPLVR